MVTSTEELDEVFEKAEERAAEREMKTRRMELELEAKMKEREKTNGMRECLPCLLQ